MSRQLKAAALCAVVAVLFVVLQVVLRIQTGMAGVFIMGVAGGLGIGTRMVETSPAPPAI